MPKYYSFPAQGKSDECPAIPKAVKVWGDHKEQGTKNDGGAALKVLAKALQDDPTLNKEHPEFEKLKTSKSSKSLPKR